MERVAGTESKIFLSYLSWDALVGALVLGDAVSSDDARVLDVASLNL